MMGYTRKDLQKTRPRCVVRVIVSTCYDVVNSCELYEFIYYIIFTTNYTSRRANACVVI